MTSATDAPASTARRVPGRAAVRLLLPLAALPLLFLSVGCDDGCGQGRHSEVTGHVWSPGHYVGKTYYPGHNITTTECVPDE